MLSNTILNESNEVSKVLDLLHEFASVHDAGSYFNLFAEDAVFLGTDASERWKTAEMKEWAVPLFNSGKGWTYSSEERHVYLSDDGCIAWFDEKLINEKFGSCRGSGVLKKVEKQWKIAQYNLTIPIPNDIALSVVNMVKNRVNS
jgi:SnoaL-like domain